MIIKELLKENIKNLNNDTYINGLSIEFKGDYEFIVVDKNNRVVFRDLIKNYDTTFKSQKEFILKVASRVTSFIEVLEDVNKAYFDNLFEISIDIINDEKYSDVIGDWNIYKTDTYIEIDMEGLYEDCDENLPYGECCSEFINNEIDYYIKEIKKYFDLSGVRVVLYYDNEVEKAGFYVSANRYESEVFISYIGASSNVVSYNSINLYYSLLKDEEEVEEAIEFIKELVR